MERSLILLTLIALILGGASVAIGQTYYGNAYPGQAPTYLPYGQQYGQQGYGRNYANSGQYATPGYQQHTPYYGNYNDYVTGRGNQYGNHYQQAQPTQPAQPNPYYGMGQSARQQQHAYYQRQQAQPGASNSPMAAGPGALAGYASNTIPSIEEMFQPGTPSSSSEIYWDPNSMPETPQGAVVTPYQANPDPRRARLSPQNNVKPKQKKKRRVKRSASRNKPKPPQSKGQAIKWGKQARDEKPQAPDRKAITWGKKKESAQAPTEASPKPSVMKWGKSSTAAPPELDVEREPQVTTKSAQAPQKETAQSSDKGGFSWGKQN